MTFVFPLGLSSIKLNSMMSKWLKTHQARNAYDDSCGDEMQHLFGQKSAFIANNFLYHRLSLAILFSEQEFLCTGNSNPWMHISYTSPLISLKGTLPINNTVAAGYLSHALLQLRSLLCLPSDLSGDDEGRGHYGGWIMP